MTRKAPGGGTNVAREARRVASSRPGHETTAVPLRTNGVVNRVSMTAAGEQTAKVQALAVGTRHAAVEVAFPGLTMQFRSCEQVQVVLGLFSIARQARMGMPDAIALPGLRIPGEIDMYATIAWTRVPMGAASREQFTHPISGKVTPCVHLTIDPLTVVLLDTTAMETMVHGLVTAHRLAIATFDDGPQFAKNSAASSWRPRAQHRYRITGTGWLIDNPGHRPPGEQA